MKAIWKNTILAESDQTLVIEGNHYFPPNSVKMEYLKADPEFTSQCPWKGTANYYDVVVNGETNQQAAWTYKDPKPGSPEQAGGDFANYIAFWRGVEVVE